ncbi:hypothetical protein GGS24DRAFT_89163 [Hypoxylon argillaceum]|nr:hypothetical protein GGS24DRAFT_89163 [Hypoxylon argillaceum]
MRLFRLLPSDGWQRSGAVNVVLAYICDVVLLILLLISVSQPNASLSGSTIIFQGDCNLSTELNLILHLLINIVSGGILASSNFFMQVLNSPSREEIDKTHQWLRSVDIGVPSLKNLRQVSRFKFGGWVVFLISSIPIHLFFNSAIFHTAYEGSQWHLTIAAETFIKGAPYFPPGASLTPAGAAGPLYKWVQSKQQYEAPDNNKVYYDFYTNDSISSGYPFNGYWDNDGINGYGESIAWDQYISASSTIHQNISSTAVEAGAWDLLNATLCQTEYLSCKPRTVYTDVVVIINSTGWARSKVFNLGPNLNLTSHWDAVVPPESLNSLWFSAQCTTTRDPQNREASCMNTCNGALGKNNSRFSVQDVPPVKEPWLLPFFPPVRLHNQSLFGEGIAFNDAYDSLLVDYCLAKPAPSPNCKIGVSNLLLLAVIVSILLKAIQGTIVIWKLPSESLVTPGDAIQSFISNPDLCTQGLGTLSINESRQLEYGFRRHWVPDTTSDITTFVQPRKWTKKKPRLFSAVDYKNWIQTYRFLLASLGLLLFGLIYSLMASRDEISFLLDYSNGFTPITIGRDINFLGILLLANIPQLIFSVCYSVYNAMITRLQVEKDWNSFCQSYQPLRVSYPAGLQVSTYRLQLPYSLSIPLIGASIGFHFLVSSGIFLFVADGGYLDGEFYSNSGLGDIFHVSDSSLISLGYSTGFILVLFILCVVLIISPPLLLSLQRLKGDMVAGGSNSLVISAACHVTDINVEERASELADNQSDSSRDMLLPRSQYFDYLTAKEAEKGAGWTLLPLVQRKLRWGAMLLPQEAGDLIAGFDDGRIVSHLGFGGEEHNVTKPEEGEYYI